MAEYYLISRKMAEEIAQAINDKYDGAFNTITGEDFAGKITGITTSSGTSVNPLKVTISSNVTPMEINAVEVLTSTEYNASAKDNKTLYIIAQANS